MYFQSIIDVFCVSAGRKDVGICHCAVWNMLVTFARLPVSRLSCPRGLQANLLYTYVSVGLVASNEQ